MFRLCSKIRDIDHKAGIVTVRIWSTNFRTYDVSSYYQTSLDPLNVGLLKRYGENLVVAFLGFFLVDDECYWTLRMQISLRS